MKKGLLIVLLVLVVLTSACSKVGQGMSPVSLDAAGREVSTPTQVTSTAKATPTTVAKATGKVTAQPTTAQKSTGGQYIEANKPATRYTYIVEKVDISGGKIVKVYLKPPPSGKTISDQDIRWSDRYAIELYNRGLLGEVLSKEPNWREVLNVGIWVARAGLWIQTKDPTLDINKYVGSVPLPADSRTVLSWVDFTWRVNFDRENPNFKALLVKLDMDGSKFPISPDGKTQKSLEFVIPGVVGMFGGKK